MMILTAVPPSPRPVIVPSPLPGGSAASTPRHRVEKQGWQEDPDQGSSGPAQPLADITNRAPGTGVRQPGQICHCRGLHIGLLDLLVETSIPHTISWSA